MLEILHVENIVDRTPVVDNLISRIFLLKAIKRIEHDLNNKHITVVLPPRNPARSPSPPLATRLNNYPQIDSPLSPFSVLRCASFNVLNSDASPADAQFDTLIDLVTSNRPPIDMAQ